MDLVEIRKKARMESDPEDDLTVEDHQGDTSLDSADINLDEEIASDDAQSFTEQEGGEPYNGLIIDDYPTDEDEINDEITSDSEVESSRNTLDLLSDEDMSLLDINDSDLHVEAESNQNSLDVVSESDSEEIQSDVFDDLSGSLPNDKSENISKLTTQFIDPLEALFSSNSHEMELATEENYFDGLLGAEKVVDDTRQLLSFMLKDEEYAVEISSVREIIKVKEVTEIPRVPPYVLGLLSLRGVIIPVFDLNQRLNLGETEIKNQSRIVVCQQGAQYAGFLVDRINQVVKIPEEKIELAPSILSNLDRDFVQGIGRLHGRMIILLDLETVMATSH